MSIKLINNSEYADMDKAYVVQNGVYVPIQKIYTVKNSAYNLTWQNTIGITVYGAASETITFSDGTVCKTDSSGYAIANLKPGVTLTATGSISGYTSAEQTIVNGVPFYVMPTLAYYWYGNMCSWNSGGWGTFSKGTSNRIDSYYSNSAGTIVAEGQTPVFNANSMAVRAYAFNTSTSYSASSAYGSAHTNNSISYSSIVDKTLNMKYDIDYVASPIPSGTSIMAISVLLMEANASKFTTDGSMTSSTTYISKSMGNSYNFDSKAGTTSTTNVSNVQKSATQAGLTNDVYLIASTRCVLSAASDYISSKQNINSNVKFKAIWFE